MTAAPALPLHQLDCDTDYHGAQPIAPEYLAELLPQISGWRVTVDQSAAKLCCRYKRHNFTDAIALAAAVGVIADRQDHHPTILVEYGAVTVTWWTHAIGGLHLNDLIMAAKTDKIAASNRCH